MVEVDKHKYKWDMSKYKKMIKGISIDKWILMGLAGLVLVLCSDSCSMDETKDNEKNNIDEVGDGNSENSSSAKSVNVIDQYIDNLEAQLEEILSSVQGAGQVKVMITIENTSTKEVLMEEPYTESVVNETDSEGGTRQNSDKSKDFRVIYEENSQGDTVPFVVTESMPDVSGVAVVAQGGDSAIVKEKITSIIKALFDIEINKIAVGKMK